MTSRKNFLFSLVGIFFVFTTVKFYSFYTEYSTWQYADWLINYQGGLVRRGLIGEILFRLHKFTSVDLDILIFLFVTSLYVIFSYYLLKSIKYIENSNTLGIHPNYKEALLMAVLGYSRINQLKSNMPSVTGTNCEVILGEIFTRN